MRMKHFLLVCCLCLLAASCSCNEAVVRSVGAQSDLWEQVQKDLLDKPPTEEARRRWAEAIPAIRLEMETAHAHLSGEEFDSAARAKALGLKETPK
jgi:hypothetical protein